MVANKIDLGRIRPRAAWRRADGFACRCRREAGGVELVRQELLRIAGWHAHGEDVILARERHLLARGRSGMWRLQARNSVRSNSCRGSCACAGELGTITGEFSADDLLGVIFSPASIGKWG